MGRSTKIVLSVAGVVGVTIASVAVWFFASSNVDGPTDVTAPPVAPGSSATADRGGPIAFELREGTVARFRLDEELRGQPATAIGETRAVVGQVVIDIDDAAASEVGTILINARTFETGQNFRNRAVRGPILDSQNHEFIEFAPTSIDGLNGAVAPGDTVTFSLTGELTVKGITKPVTFDVTAAMVGADRLEGSAVATVLRSDFELAIPNAPGVANVSDQVELSIDFVALPA